MSISMKDLNGNNAIVAYKVIAKHRDPDEPVAEFIFAEMKQAMLFEIGMREKGYTTAVERINV